MPLAPPQEGKGLLSWIFNESAPGKTLGKGYVRLNPLEEGDRTEEDDDNDDNDRDDAEDVDGVDGNTEGDEAGLDGLEGLVRAAERRAKRKAARREKAQSASTSTSADAESSARLGVGSSSKSKPRQRTFGLELNVLLKSVPMCVTSAASTLTSTSTGGATGAGIDDDLDVKVVGGGLGGMKTSMDVLGARAASQGQHQVRAATQGQGQAGMSRARPGLGGVERAASSPGLLAAMSATTLSGSTATLTTTEGRTRRISALPGSKSMVGLGGKTGMATSSTTATTTIDLTGSKPKLVHGANDDTPPRQPIGPGTSSGGTLIADILRTPRQGSKKSGTTTAGSPMQTDRPPQSSPATHMALARQVLRNPTSHTIDLAQKLVGKDAFAQILMEMGVQVGNGNGSGKEGGAGTGSAAGSSKQGAGEASASAAAAAALTRARTKAGPTTLGPNNKGKGRAVIPTTGPPTVTGTSATSTAGPTSAGAAAATTAKVGGPSVPVVKPVCKNCGTTETPRWRVKTLADGKERRVCDACGIYFNKMKQMRPKELWSPNAKRIPLEDIPKQEAAMAASRAAAAKQMASLGKASTVAANQGASQPGRSTASQPAPSQPMRQAAAAPIPLAHKTNEVSFAELPASPPRQPRTLSESVFTTPRRSTRLSQGGSSKNPRTEHDDVAEASPKLRRTPRRMAATAAASKVKATFEGHTGVSARQNKFGGPLTKDEPQVEPKTSGSTGPIPAFQAGRSPSRDRSLTPPPVSEAASRHNESSSWQVQSNDLLGEHHGSNDLFERFTAIGNGAVQAETSDTDQLDYDLSTWIDMAPLDNDVQAAAVPALPDPVIDAQDIKFTLDEMNLLLSLTQNQDMLDFSSQTELESGGMQIPDWDPSSPWSLPTPSGGTISVPQNWLDNSLSTEIAGSSGQAP
jgi:hypothetical protein